MDLQSNAVKAAVALLSTVFTATLIQFASTAFFNDLPPVNIERTVSRIVPEHFLTPHLCSLLDEPVLVYPDPEPTRKQLLTITSEGFSNLFKDSHLIIAYAPWCPHSQRFLREELPKYQAALHAMPHIRLALLDANAEPKLAAAMSIREYPAILLATEDGKLQHWPLGLRWSETAARFIQHSGWQHMPVFWRLSRKTPTFTALQISIFNVFGQTVSETQEKTVRWISRHQEATSMGLSIATLLGVALEYRTGLMGRLLYP